MEVTEDSNVPHQFHSSFGTSSSSTPKHQNQQFDSSQIDSPNMPQFPQISNSQSNKKLGGIPPTYPHVPHALPYSITSPPLKPSFFNIDSLPPLSPPLKPALLPEPLMVDVSMEDMKCSSNESKGLPPRRGHRRSNSDIPSGLSTTDYSPRQFISIRSEEVSDKLIFGNGNFGMDKLIQLQWNNDSEKIGDLEFEGGDVEEMFRTYMNIENELDNKASERNTNACCDSSDNEVESTMNRSIHGVKRNAVEDITPSSRHFRSISMDSFMGNFDFLDDSLKIPLSPSNSIDGSSSKFSIEFGNGEFSGAELKKIMVNEKLSEIAISDPKRVKRILANRQSAARSKERKVKYMSELEHKVHTLQVEATTLSNQVTVLQRDSDGLTNQNNELKFRIQSMEQQAQLRDALHETLTAEVHHLKLATAKLRGGTQLSNSPSQHLSFNRPPFNFQDQRTTELDIYHLQQQLQQQKAQHVEDAKHGSN